MANNVDIGSSSYIAQRVASNINVQDLTPQSKANVLINGLLNEGVIFKTYTHDSVADFYIQSASDEALERIGVAEGISRHKEPTLRIRSEDAVISIKQTTNYLASPVLSKGTQLELVSESYWLVLTEDLDLEQASLNKVYIGCDIKTKVSETNLSFIEGVSYPLNIEGNDYSITFERDVSVPVLEESIDNYRSRIIYAKNTPRTGSQSAARLAVASNELITDFDIDFEASPYKVVIFNSVLFEDDSGLDTLVSYVAPVLDTQLYLVKSEGASYEVSVAKKVNFSLELKPTVTSPREVSPYWETFKDFIKSLYKVGSTLVIDQSLLVQYLELQGEDYSFLSDYSFNIYKNFLGKEYLSTSKSITILADEYPFLSEVRIT